jgi:hypothetical protein
MSKIHQPTPARWSQLASACTATGAIIQGTAFASQNIYLCALGLMFQISGIFIPFFKGDQSK